MDPNQQKNRGRGRGYGRARGQSGAQQQPHQRPGAPGQQPFRGGQQQPQAPYAQNPARPRVPQQTPSASGSQAQVWPKAPAPQQSFDGASSSIGGRGNITRAAEGAIPRVVTKGGDNGNQTAGGSARGNGNGNNVRGRYGRTGGILVTKPEGVITKKGSNGTPIDLYANYLPMLHVGKWCLYQYRVDMNPDVEHTGKRKGLLRTATKEVIAGGYLFDGTVLYTPVRLAQDSMDLFVQDNDDQNIRITIRQVGEVDWGDFHYLQLFNILIRKCLGLMGLQQVGRNYFMPEEQITFPEHKIQLWPGYVTSMRKHEKNILLNVDLQFKFMRTDHVYDLLMECRGANMRKEFQSKVIGSIVLTYYNNKTYKIDDVDFASSPKSTFKLSDGSEISYADYYKKKYNINITVLDQPMLVSRSKPREIRAGMPETVILVPELCQLTGLTDRQRENFTLMRTLANHTRVGAEERMKRLVDFAKRIQSRPEVVQEIKRWDLGIANQLVRLQGRVLPTETMVGGQDQKYSAGAQTDWTRDLRTKPMFFTGKIDRLAVVTPTRFRRQTEEFVTILVKAVQGMRWSIGQPRIFEIPDDRPGTYVDNLEKIINTANPSLIMTVLSNNSQDRYNAIKKKCFVDRGIPNQAIVARNLSSKGVMSIATKVAIQLNCKVGGAPWSVVVPLSHLMVVGYDVCRDTANKKKSFGGMVASLDRQMTRYYNFAAEHQMEEELSDNFATFLVVACKNYHRVNGVYPERILIYRDGVGDGQLQYVYTHEVENIKKKLGQEIYKNNELKMAFVVVSKKITTRLFTQKDNPPPGTVVDDVITLPERYDFFIVSQCVRQGTVAPTSYNVLFDNLGLNAEKLQILTYKMTHMYYNWSGTVRVPAPCQYAHKLSFMMSQTLHRPVHPDLENILYYL